ncbi:MAG: hypothetical protein H0V31_04980, partial [Acidobacteria bacterium]|nr:hypothetical protein [Acidobacteriota bacterium]
MKQLTSLILIFTIYCGLLAPLSLKAQMIHGKTQKTNMNQSLPNGLQFHLSEGAEGAENRQKTPSVKGDALSDAETSNLLERIPPIKSATDDKSDFAKRAGSLPAPKTGKIVPVKFPADDRRETPKVNNNQILEVIRFSPTGEVSLAPDLNVTFSQPIVAVTSQEQAARTVPVELSPMPEGRWRWLGTKTLMFDAAKRFPMATHFTAKIPAGTKSVVGGVLQKDVVWTFTTPPPAVGTKIPENQTTRRDAIVFVSFDQEINPSEVIKTISVTSAGKKIPIRLATEEEISKDASISYYAKSVQPKRWLAFRAINSEGGIENALPADAPVTVTIEKGTPSAEGPITTAKAQSFSFRTFGTMRFRKGYCSWEGNKKCSPFDVWNLEFTNAIDTTTFEKSIVKIEPAVEGLNIYPSGNHIIVDGYKKGRTTYKISVDASLKDIYGQNLIPPATATINVGSAERQLYSQGGSFVVLDPMAKPAYSIYSTNHAAVKARIYKVAPSDWQAFQEYVRRINYDDSTKKPIIPGRLLSDKVVSIKNVPDEMTETRIDLSEFLDNGFGHLIIDIEPTVRGNKNDRTRIFTWAQATQIGLDAFVDSQELVGFATELKTGKPLSDVELSIYPNGSKVQSPKPKVQSQNTSQSWWQWFSSWGMSEDSIKQTETVDANGEKSTTETIEEAQTNQTGGGGILRLPLPDSQTNQQNVLIARRGKDIAFLPENTDYYWQQAGSWFKKSASDTLRWFVFDDRKMYRPKEEVAVKGYIRKIEGGKLGDVAAIENYQMPVSYSVKDSRGNEIGKGNLKLNAFGAFDFKFKLPDDANLGYSYVQFFTSEKPDGSPEFTHGFHIQEFRRPEFEVTSKVVTEAPHFVGGSANVETEAKYYAGGGLANAEVNWTVRATPTNYTPPNRGEYIFGSWIPWWYSSRPDYSNTTTQTFK